MRRKIKIVKSFILMLLLTSTVASYATDEVVNDGSSFITKTEYDTMINSFQDQLNGYLTGIDTKISDTINAYLKDAASTTDKTAVPLCFDLCAASGEPLWSVTLDDLEYVKGYPSIDITLYIFHDYVGCDEPNYSKLGVIPYVGDSDTKYNRNQIAVKNKGTANEKLYWDCHAVDLDEKFSGTLVSGMHNYDSGYDPGAYYMPLFFAYTLDDFDGKRLQPFSVRWTDWRGNIGNNWGDSGIGSGAPNVNQTPIKGADAYGNIYVNYTKKYQSCFVFDYDETAGDYFWDKDSDNSKLLSSEAFSVANMGKFYNDTYNNIYGKLGCMASGNPSYQTAAACYDYNNIMNQSVGNVNNHKFAMWDGKYVLAYAPCTTYFQPYDLKTVYGDREDPADGTYKLPWTRIYQNDSNVYTDADGESFTGYNMMQGVPLVNANTNFKYTWKPQFQLLTEWGSSGVTDYELVDLLENKLYISYGPFDSDAGSIGNPVSYTVDSDGTVRFTADRNATIFLKWESPYGLISTKDDTLWIKSGN